MRIILALTVQRFDITPTKELYRILRLTVLPPLHVFLMKNVPSDNCPMRIEYTKKALN